MKIQLRLATIHDIPLLKDWDNQPHVLQARNLTEPDTDWHWETEINRAPFWRELLIGEVDSRPVAFLQIIDPKEEDTHYWGDAPAGQRAIDIWIGEKQNLGKGYGTILMQLALHRCFADDAVEQVIIDPLEENKRACAFYETLHFRFATRQTFGDDRCAVYTLNKQVWLTAPTTPSKVICSGGILMKNDTFLFGKRSETASWYAGVWDVFGGHAEWGETPAQTLVRELGEELAIVPTQYQQNAVFTYFETGVQKIVQYHHYFITEWTGAVQNAGAEHTVIRWFTRLELATIPIATTAYLALIDAWLQQANSEKG